MIYCDTCFKYLLTYDVRVTAGIQIDNETTTESGQWKLISLTFLKVYTEEPQQTKQWLTSTKDFPCPCYPPNWDMQRMLVEHIPGSTESWLQLGPPCINLIINLKTDFMDRLLKKNKLGCVVCTTITDWGHPKG